jgi:hypothetical protein
VIVCAIAMIRSPLKAIASCVRRCGCVVSHGRRVGRGSPGIASTANSASAGMAIVSASRRFILLGVSAGGACAERCLGQAVGGGSAFRLANALARSLAQGQLACRRSVAVRA